MTARVRVLGMGNILYGDEGAGVWAAHYLRAGYEFAPEVEVLDGAALGFGVLDVFDGGGPVLVLDALVADRADAGSVYRFTDRDLLDVAADRRLAAHEVEPVGQLRLRTALGGAPPTVLLAIVPQHIGMVVALSPAVRAAFGGYLRAALDQLRGWGVTATARAQVDLDDVRVGLTTAVGPTTRVGPTSEVTRR
jgi:hydrogenase maturation protease